MDLCNVVHPSALLRHRLNRLCRADLDQVWDGDNPIATITLTAYVDVDSLWKPDRDPEALWYRASSGLALVGVPLSGSVAVGITVDSVSAGYPGRPPLWKSLWSGRHARMSSQVSRKRVCNDDRHVDSTKGNAA